VRGWANDATALILYRFAVVAISNRPVLIAESGRHFVAIHRRRATVSARPRLLSLRAAHRARDPQIEITCR